MGKQQKIYDSELLRGNTEVLVLRIIQEMGQVHGYGIIKEMRARSNGYFDFKEGTVYPVLHRLEQQEYLHADWQRPTAGMIRRNYRITDKGRAILRRKMEIWHRFSAAMNMIFSDS